MPDKNSTSVLIVGGGPTGLLASILLSKYEIPHTLVEKRATTVTAPAAHVINTRSMEIYRQAGMDVEALYALNRHPRAHLVSWRDRLENESIGVFDMAANRDALMAQSRFSGEHTTNISQHRLEAFLLEVAQCSEFAEFCFGMEWVSFVSDDRKISRLRGENGGVVELGYEYLVAADGASSSVARSLEIKKAGPDAIATFLNLTCEVDVTSAAGEDGTLLYWLLDPAVRGTIIVHDPQRLSVYMRPLVLSHESVEDYDDERCQTLLRDVFAGQPFKVTHKGVWKMTAQDAETFREGVVFLAGDAIHRFPPTGGLGLNTGVGDVHNLVWKLAVALHGRISADQIETLLDSYELERRPVAQRNCDVSKHNNDKMSEVVVALGLDRSVGRSEETIRAQLSDATSDTDTGLEIRTRVAAAVANQREHFSSLGLDLGYVYREGCAVSDSAQTTPGSDVVTYVEAVGAGARMPERQLDNLGRLHDLLDYQSFTLLTSGGADDSVIPDTFGIAVVRHDLDASIWASLGMQADQWILVRPDGHVLAVSE